MRVVPILEFHGVGAAPEKSHLAYLHWSVERMRNWFRLLRRLGFRGVSVSEAVRNLDGADGGRVVGLSFDDGYRDAFEGGLPLLIEYGFTATCFAVSARLGGWNEWDRGIPDSRRELMTASDLRAWQAAGMEVGGHTRTHAHLGPCSDEGLAEEVAGCRRELEDLLGTAVNLFAYPWGEHDDRVVESVREAGFRGAVTVRRARARSTDDRFRLPRIGMRSDRGSFELLLRVLGHREERPRAGPPPNAHPRGAPLG